MREIKKKFDRYLRKDQTSSEEKVWELLKDRRLLGLKFRRQHAVLIKKIKEVIQP